MKSILFFILPFFFLFGSNNFWQISVHSKQETFNNYSEKNDSLKIKLITVKDSLSNNPIFYYSDITTPVCFTGECRIVDIRIYWDLFGNYLKYEIPYNKPFTKKNHKEFKSKDYQKLHQILNNPTSKFKDLNFEDLTYKEVENSFYDDIDGVSGATVVYEDLEYITGAIKTTYTLWQIANGKTKDVINDLTSSAFLFKKNDEGESDDLSIDTNQLKLWNEYKQATDEVKFNILNKFIETEHPINIEILRDISLEIVTSDRITTTFYFEVLNGQYIDDLDIVNGIVGIMKMGDDYRSYLSYNYFKRKKIKTGKIRKTMKEFKLKKF